jgi:hypothetical protein
MTSVANNIRPRNSCSAASRGTVGGSSFLEANGPTLDTKKITGKGTQLTPLQRRARAKAWSHRTTLALMAVTKSAVQRKRYARTLQCCELMEQRDGKITTYYCQSRACNVCQRIKVQVGIQNYGAYLDQWVDEGRAQFITVTLPSVSADMLRPTLKRMHTVFGRVIKEIQRLYGQGGFFQGLRATEVTWNPRRAAKGLPAYHPHIHSCWRMTPEVAEHFVSLWMKFFPDATRSAQDIRKADSNGKYELLKYLQKAVQPMKDADGTPLIVPPVIQDEIYGSLYRLRCWQAYGLTPLAGDEDCLKEDEAGVVLTSGTDAVELTDEHVIWTYRAELFDWVDMKTGLLLSNYCPSRKTLRILDQFLPTIHQSPGHDQWPT